MTDQRARWSTVAVDRTRGVADDVRELVLRYEHPVAAPPGSHVDVAVPLGAAAVTRSYSVVSADAAARSVTVAVRLAGDGSRYLHGRRPGDRLRVTEPLQGFALTPGRPGYVLVAAGIGITPLLPMFRALRSTGAAVRLVYAGPARERMPYAAELSATAEFAVSAEGRRLDPAAAVAAVPEGHELYVCGPLGLLDALRTAWRAAGRPAGGLRFETFGSSGRHGAEEFVVEVPRLSLRTTVPAGESILGALERAGADVMSDCRRGECGLCEVRVLACTGVIDHRDVFLSEAQRAEGDHLCTCVTRVAGPDARLVLDLP